MFFPLYGQNYKPLEKIFGVVWPNYNFLISFAYNEVALALEPVEKAWRVMVLESCWRKKKQQIIKF